MGVRRVWAGSFAVGGLFLSACQAPTPEVEGWRPLTARETEALIETRAAESPELPRPITELQIDANHDGAPDRVVLMVNDAGDRFAPVIFDGAGAPPVVLSKGEPRSRMQRFGLSVMGWGHLYVMCREKAVAIYDCEAVKDRNGHVVALLDVDHGGALFPWNGASYDERTMWRDLYHFSRDRPADEHPLAKHPWYVRQRPMQPDDRLPTFQRQG